MYLEIGSLFNMFCNIKHLQGRLSDSFKTESYRPAAKFAEIMRVFFSIYSNRQYQKENYSSAFSYILEEVY